MIKPSVKRNEHYVPILQVRLASRGGKKWVTQIWNYVDFPQQISDPKECCSKIARKFAGSCGLTTMPDGTEELMALQGNFVREVITFFEDLGVPKDQIFVAEQQKHKGKKKDAKKNKQKARQAQRNAEKGIKK